MKIDGKKISQEVLSELKEEVMALRQAQGKPLRLAAVLIGDKPELKKFVELKQKAAESVGIGFKSYFFNENISEEDLKKEISNISADENVDGIFIELPLPEHINSQNILDTIPPKKDLDILSQENQDKFFSGDFTVLPPAVEAVNIVFEKHDINPKGKKVVMFGYGFLVGKPISYWLGQQGADVSVIRSKTENPEQYSKEADIVIAGVGKPDLIMGDMVKEGVVVIDFGYGPDSSKSETDLRRIEDPRFSGPALREENRDKKVPKMRGDVNYKSVESKASLITPVPGGVGPILIVATLRNLVKLNEK